MCREMRPAVHHPPRRINLDDLKTQIVEKIGPELSKQYFYYLNRFFNYKISKDDFNKVCLHVIGRDNIPLHNRLFQSIIKNAYGSKIPPPPSNKKQQQQQQVSKTSIATVGSRELQSDWNKKTESLPNGKTNNGCLKPYISQSVANLDKLELASEVKKMEEKKEKSSAWSLLKAPLGVPLCSASVGGAHHTQPVSNIGSSLSSSEIGVLLDSAGVKKRMEQIALAQGLEGGVSADCANLLKAGLDSYLKNLISSSVSLNARPQPTPSRYMNGLIHDNRSMQNSNRVGSISLQDFKAAMELNPLQLGEDWPILLERLCNRSFNQ
ncbi:uncharacterized protein LOC124920461 [Impatiens glandulifera]|uniref:uncharacterized protein LOC124920461 n=1 Tax=Impatiens glandulifera TaxID=253017 RepID=UPI001FB08217|nr:uncharacterized protein LOC124920461 [Impatiens glandulifera]